MTIDRLGLLSARIGKAKNRMEYIAAYYERSIGERWEYRAYAEYQAAIKHYESLCDERARLREAAPPEAACNAL